MSRRTVSFLCCDLCGYEEESAYRADGWVVDEWSDGSLVDLCPRCRSDVLPGAAS